MSTEFEINSIDLYELDDTQELLQTSFWGNFKKATGGWQAQAFRLSLLNLNQELSFLVLSRKIAGPLWLAYVPFGPYGLSAEGVGQRIEKLTEMLKPHLPHPLLALRWDLPVVVDHPLVTLPPLKKGQQVQVPDTVIIDLTKPESQLLAEMERGHRYNVNYAERKGVIVTDHGAEAVAQWYALFQQTTERDSFKGHPASYYQTFMDMMEAYQGRGKFKARVFLAHHETDLLAGCIVSLVNGRATYLYSASSNLKRNLKSVYLMIWRVMQWAKSQGCHTLDMCGIPPDANPKHPLAGLYDFKRYFGGQIVHRAGSWDVPMNILYRPFRILEKLRH